jgi:hypothetical protein
MIVATMISFQTWLEPGSVEPFAHWREWSTGDWAVSLWGFVVLASALAAFGIGLLAILARGDRTASVLAAVGVGGLIGVILLQQVAEGLGWLTS